MIDFEKMARDIETSATKLDLQFDPGDCWGETFLMIILRGGDWDGWRIIYFEDCGDMDYIEEIYSPTGPAVWAYEDHIKSEDPSAYTGHNLLDRTICRRLRPEEALRDLAIEEYYRKVDRGEAPPPKPLWDVWADSFFAPSPFYSYLKSKCTPQK